MSKLCAALLLAILGLRCSPAAASPLVISEFMASNASTLTDEDGDFSDWIEVRNISGETINLLNWSLTDDPAQPGKWRFPDTNLVAGGYLIVFASDKNRRNPGAPLHTNFRLGAGGEFLALLEPDGVTIASEFAPAFAAQVANVSYGLDTGLRQTTVLPANSPGKLLVPADDVLGTNWTNLEFNDDGWRPVTSAVGYEASWHGHASHLGLTNGLVSYWRFDETNGLTAVDSSGRGNNAFLVNFPTNNSQWMRGLNRGALRFRGSPANDFVRVANYPKASNALTVAAWVWADSRPAWASIAKNWGAALAGQFHFGLRDTAGDLDVFITTSSGQTSLRESVLFPLERWQHVAFTADGSTLRLYRNGTMVATRAYTGAFVTPPRAALGIGAKLNDAGTAADTGSPGHWNGRIDDLALWTRALSDQEMQALHQLSSPYGDLIRSDVRDSLLGRNATCYLRFLFTVDNPQVLTRWRLQVRYDDGFAAWLNGTEVVRRNAPEPLAWNSAATMERSAEEALAAEEFNLSAFAERIVPGTNVLAIHGLNAAPDDGDFFLQPALEASSLTETTNALVYFTTPTPGRENTVGNQSLGPIIKEVAHLPAVPRDDDFLWITARVTPAFAPVTNVTLHYRVMFSNEVALPMFDDGVHGDGLAGDHSYGAIILPDAYTPGQMVRYYVTARDAGNAASRWPLFDQPLDSDRYLGTVVHDPSIDTRLPVVHWFVANPATADTDTGSRCSLSYQGEFYDNLFVRIRGGTARSWPKKSYKLEFNEDHEFLLHPDLPRITEFDLNATYTDKSSARALLAYEFGRDAGLPSPETFHVHLRQNARFFSVAFFVEQPDKDFLKRHGLDPNGALYKGNPGSTYDTAASFEKKTRRTEGNADLQTLLTGLALNTNALETFVFDQLDLPGLINFMAIVAVTQNIDGSDKNHFLYRDTLGSGEWRILPWDLDLTFGPNALNTDTIVYNQQDAFAPACASHPFIGTRPYLLHSGKYNRLLEAAVKVSRAKEMLLRRVRTLTDQYLAAGYFPRRLDQLLPLLDRDVTLDQARWGVNTHFGGASYTLPQAINRIRNEYLTPRLSYLTGTNIAGVGAAMPSLQPLNALIHFGAIEFNPSSGNQAEEYLALSNTAPFAVDLSGWTLSGAVQFAFKPGTIIPSNGLLYLSPDVAAFRARNASPHGGQRLFVQGNYQGQLSARGETVRLLDTFGRVAHSVTYPGASSPAQQYLRITELMYSPMPPAANPADPQEFEYIELKNIGPSTLSLAGVRFLNGVTFDFTGSAVTSLGSGQRVLVVRNAAAFAARYGGGFSIAGQYGGTLDNRGEQLHLIDASGEEILDFDYENDWYPLTDGHGFSLVTVNEGADPEDWRRKEQWRASGRLNGSPGMGEPALPVIGPVLVNEVLSASVFPQTDAIELLNTNAGLVNIGGWYLSDDFNTPKKYRIPDNTMIAAGNHLTFNESQFNAAGVGFAFSSDGDEAWLFSADAGGELTGYVHGFKFGAAEPSVSFGRHVTSTGEEHFVAQAARSLGDINAGPQVGPVVINEIMYRPPNFGTNDNSLDEFIELRNVSNQAVPLFDPVFPANTWKIVGGVEFDFPTNITLAAGQYLLLVEFDPVTNTPALGVFRARYGVGADVPIFGPYEGQLSNSGETVELMKPAMPLASRVPYVSVDRADYADRWPWPPGADGFGLSLQRKNPAAYGNDPSNWTAAPSTAAAPVLFSGDPPVIVGSPLSQTVVASMSAILQVSAVGSGPLRHQWRFNGMNLPGATNATLELPNVQPSDAGDYQVLVFNGVGSALSSNATITVLFPPSILQQPSSSAVLIGTNLTLNVRAYSPLSIAYQWRLHGNDLAGATQASLTLPQVRLSDDGFYSVVLTDAVGAVVSAPARVTVLMPPAVVHPSSPLSLSVAAGEDVTLSLVSMGTLPINYRWRRGGATLTNAYLTNHSSFFTLRNVQSGNSTITVVLTNAANAVSGLLSTNAILTVLADTDGDRLPDPWEMEHQLDLSNAADALVDSDGDTQTNYQEYIAGTDPRDASSYLKVDHLSPRGISALGFLAVSNRTYTVQFKNRLSDAVWTKLIDVPAQPVTRQESVVDTKALTSRYYRLATPRLP